MSNMIDYAKRELDAVGMTENSDDYSSALRSHILKMIELFADEGHSGSSAAYAVNCLNKLLRFEPLSPLTGEDDEWHFINSGPEIAYQNNRCYRVFKRADGTAYDSCGRAFIDKDGYSYTSSGSSVNITFPYTPKTEYIEDNKNA